jgi:hypothetical protein
MIKKLGVCAGWGACKNLPLFGVFGSMPPKSTPLGTTLSETCVNFQLKKLLKQFQRKLCPAHEKVTWMLLKQIYHIKNASQGV